MTKRPSAIVTTTYRYNRPPRRKKPVALEVLAVVRKSESRDSRSTNRGEVAALSDATDRKAAIVTIRGMPAKILPLGLLPETPEEHQRRGDAADALWRGLVRRATAKP
jgi:hypothetical protein